MYWVLRCSAVAILSLVGALYCLFNGSVLSFLPLFVVGLVAFDIATHEPDRTNTFKGLIVLYIGTRIIPACGWLANKLFIRKTINVRKTQGNVLIAILEKHKKTDIGQKYGFSSVSTQEDYQRVMPLTSYPDYESYIDRYMKGEQGLLVSDEVKRMAVTSGTTGKFKRFIYLQNLFKLLPRLMYNERKWMKRNFGKVFYLNHRPKVETTECGITIATYSYFLLLDFGGTGSPYMIAPSVTSEISNQEKAHYILALLALGNRDGGLMSGIFSVYCYSFFKLIESNWRELCDQIENGSIKPEFDIEDKIRRKLNGMMTPDPIRANELRELFASANNEGLGLKIWPHLKGVNMITGGSQLTYTNLLSESYLKGVPILCMYHGSTEAFMGMRTGDITRDTYVPVIDSTFFEFIPEEELDAENPSVLLIGQLEKGRCYEVVVTTNAGLYRYRQGDVIRVVEYLNECPIYEFAYRRNQALRHGRTSEDLLNLAVTRAMEPLKHARLIDFSATESIDLKDLRENDGTRIHYVLFVEIAKEDGVVYRLSEDEKHQFEVQMCHVSEVYNLLRQNNSLDPVEVIQLKSGAFHKLQQEVTRETGTAQYKTPRVLTRQHLLRLLLENSC